MFSERLKELRIKKNLTQEELANEIFVSRAAISKWERGIAMPDSSVMLDLCGILGISVNELLNGGRIMDNEQKNEELLLEMTKELERKNKTIWNAMWAIMTVSIIGLIAGLLISAFLIPEGPWMLVAILSVVIVFLIPCFYALKLEVSVGAYKCKNCGHEITPTYKEALNAMHLGTTRYLTCPECKKRSWCKKVINK